MSSNSFVSTVDLTPRPSMRAIKLLFWLHVILIALLLFAMQPEPMMWALLGLLALSWLGLRWHPVFGLGRKAITRMIWHAEGGWTLRDAAGGDSAAELLGSSFVHPVLLVLNFRLKQGGRRTRVLLGDELDPELMRRLRARLSVFRETRPA
jgi:toxin CptA